MGGGGGEGRGGLGGGGLGDGDGGGGLGGGEGGGGLGSGDKGEEGWAAIMTVVKEGEDWVGMVMAVAAWVVQGWEEVVKEVAGRAAIGWVEVETVAGEELGSVVAGSGVVAWEVEG